MTDHRKHARPGRWRVYAEGAVAAGAVGVLAVSLSGGGSSGSGRVISDANPHQGGPLSAGANALVPGSSGRTISEPAPALALASNTRPSPSLGTGPVTTQSASDQQVFDAGDDGDNGDQSGDPGQSANARSGGHSTGGAGSSTGGSSTGGSSTGGPSVGGSGATGSSGGGSGAGAATVGGSTGSSTGAGATPVSRPPSYSQTTPAARSTTTTWPAQPGYGGDGHGGHLNGTGILSGMAPGYSPAYTTHVSVSGPGYAYSYAY